VTVGWGKVYNEEVHTFHLSPNLRMTKSRKMRWAGHAAPRGEIRNSYKSLVGKPDGKKPFERPKRGWEDNIKIYLKERGWAGVDWINLAQDGVQWRSLMNTAMNHRVLKGV
jgi:hypothetical protein